MKKNKGIIVGLRDKYPASENIYNPSAFTLKDFNDFLDDINTKNKEYIEPKLQMSAWGLYSLDDKEFIRFCNMPQLEVIGGQEPINLIEQRMKKLGIIKDKTSIIKSYPKF